jgi:cytochrome c-type biogenesis protein CcsB
MTSTDLNTYVVFGYLTCGVGYLLALLSTAPESRIRRAMFAMFLLIWGVHTAAIGLRWWESYRMGIGHAPLSNLYESLVFFAWTVGLALIVLRWKFGLDALVVMGIGPLFLVMGSTFFLDPQIKPLIPALQSNWLVAHVITCFLGYAGFLGSFVAAIMLLASKSWSVAERSLPRREILDEIVYRAVLVGFPLLTIGIITGSAWADYAWGSYWSWDPKETWSLITWLVYAAFLHARLTVGWAGTRTAALSVIGFAAVMFTYFGVNYLPGLHSYF